MKQLKIRTEILLSHQSKFMQMSKETGLSINTIKSIAQGKQRRIDFYVLEKIANYLNVQPLELLEEEDVNE